MKHALHKTEIRKTALFTLFTVLVIVMLYVQDERRVDEATVAGTVELNDR